MGQGREWVNSGDRAGRRADQAVLILGGGRFGSSHKILTPFLDLIHLNGSTKACISNCNVTGQNWPRVGCWGLLKGKGTNFILERLLLEKISHAKSNGIVAALPQWDLIRILLWETFKPLPITKMKKENVVEFSFGSDKATIIIQKHNTWPGTGAVMSQYDIISLLDSPSPKECACCDDIRLPYLSLWRLPFDGEGMRGSKPPAPNKGWVIVMHFPLALHLEQVSLRLCPIYALNHVIFLLIIMVKLHSENSTVWWGLRCRTSQRIFGPWRCSLIYLFIFEKNEASFPKPKAAYAKDEKHKCGKRKRSEVCRGIARGGANH